MRLLVVDDDSHVLETLLECLEDAGFEVTPAATGEDAIEKAASATPDMLVTDLDLGAGMNGMELAAKARRLWPNLPVLYISGRPWLMNGREFDRHEKLLPKPFRYNELLGSVRSVSEPD